MTFQSDEELS